MTDTHTIEARLAEVLPCEPAQMCELPDFVCIPCSQRHQILTLIHTLLREERERCAEIVDENPFDGSGDKCIARTIRNLGDRE